jgi:hypothetical protein
MKNLFKHIVLILCGVSIILSPLTQASQYDTELLNLTNAERQRAGLPPLRLSSQLGPAAQGHAEDMARNNYFNHQGLNGSTPSDRATAVGYRYSYVGENISAGNKTPTQTIQQWMNSPGHRQNILNPSYTEIGFGYAYANSSSYRYYWVQVFGSQQGGSQRADGSRPRPATSSLVWKTSKAEALAMAKNQRKYVLLAACGSKDYPNRTFTTPEVQNFIRQNFILWFSIANSDDREYTGEYNKYLGGMKEVKFPLVIVINPATDQPVEGYRFPRAQEQQVLSSLQRLISSPRTTTNTSNSPTQTTSKVCLYEHINYGGWEKCFSSNQPNFVSLGINDQVSSLKIYGSLSVCLYEHINYGGWKKCFGGNQPNFVQLGINDQVSSLSLSVRAPMRQR